MEKIRMHINMDVIKSYAELTDDFNPIHVDPVFASQTPMKGVIAHGTMSICLLWESIARSFNKETLNNIDIDVRFIRPVRLGDTIEAGGRPNTDKPGCYDVWVCNDSGKAYITGHLKINTI